MTAEEVTLRLQDRPARWVQGRFGPLLAAHVRRLRESAPPGQALVVEVTSPPNPLLPARARAELVAALAMVDFVVIRPEAVSSARDDDITDGFVEHVLRRHGGDEGR